MYPAEHIPPGSDPIDNPLWEGIEQLARRGIVTINKNLLTVTPGERQALRTLLAQYGPVIPDPALLAWLRDRVGAGVVEIDAGTGYWTFLFTQMRKIGVAYDRKPPRRTWVRVLDLDQRRHNLTGHDNLTLFSVLPKPVNLALALAHYHGGRIIVITDQVLQDHKRLGEALAGQWVLREQTQGVCWSDKQYLVYLYERPKPAPLWSMPTVAMAILQIVS